MSTLQSTFKRYEKKYMINEEQYHQIKECLKDYTLSDEYGSYTVCNLYFDTDNYEIIRHSIDKPVYKEKLRVRSYGIPGENDRIFLELKKKYKKEVFKRRIHLTVKEFEDYIYKGIKPDKSEQILAEIDYYINMYKPYPRIFIACEREALKGKEDKNLRITFDRDIRYRETSLSLQQGSGGTRIVDENMYLMEIKAEGAMPLWLSGILNSMCIYPRSFSKYGYCFTNYLNAAYAG